MSKIIKIPWRCTLHCRVSCGLALRITSAFMAHSGVPGVLLGGIYEDISENALAIPWPGCGLASSSSAFTSQSGASPVA
jgi:hypothetical protein